MNNYAKLKGGACFIQESILVKFERTKFFNNSVNTN